MPSQVALLASDPLGEVDFGNEPDIANDATQEEEGEESEASSPIEAPQPLFDTRPLNQDGDIDDPVSGTGNPGLLGPTPGEGGNDDQGGGQ